jgi:hypothetical protein
VWQDMQTKLLINKNVFVINIRHSYTLYRYVTYISFLFLDPRRILTVRHNLKWWYFSYI